MQNKKQITICSNCKIPLIWTFKWAYNEWFCINCGGHWGMMGRDSTELTPELKVQDKVIQRLWKVISFNLVVRGAYGRDDCKKCNGGFTHHTHLSLSEKRKDKLATSMLKKLKGAWN
jgi:hypothetical protein